MGRLLRSLLFISSYIPIFIMIFLNNLTSFNFEDIAQTWNKSPVLWIIMLILGIGGYSILVLWLFVIKQSAKERKQKFILKDIKKYDSEILNYFVTFIIPILTLKPTSLPSIVMNALLIIIEGIYFISNNALYFNVLLIIMGYHVYSAENETKIIITKNDKEKLNFLKCTQIGTSNIFYA